MARCLVRFVMLVTLAAGAVLPAPSQTSSDLQTYFSKSIGLSQDQITAIRNGQPVAKLLNSRTPAEIYVFGAIYINATPASYVQFAYDFNRLSKMPGYLAVR